MRGRRAESTENNFTFGVIETIIAVLVILFVFLPIIAFIMQQFMPDRNSANALKNVNAMVLELKKEFDGTELSTIVPVKMGADDILIADSTTIDGPPDQICIYNRQDGKTERCSTYANTIISIVGTIGDQSDKIYHLKLTIKEDDGKKVITIEKSQ